MRYPRTPMALLAWLAVSSAPGLAQTGAQTGVDAGPPAATSTAPALVAPAPQPARRSLPWAAPSFSGAVQPAGATPAAAAPTAAATPTAPPPQPAATAPAATDAVPPPPVRTTVRRQPVRARGPFNAVPAKKLFGAAATPAALTARAIGSYSRGCLAGARQIAVDGPNWQAMRLSRNRRWGHPVLIGLIEKLARESHEKDGWPGLLVGDIAQARGGPMLTGHASHQIGLDADVWLTPMPSKRLTARQREDLSATSMLADKVSVDAKVWTDKHAALIKRAASYAEVERILVHPAIKKALCAWAGGGSGGDRAWLARVRPYWGHHYHFHIRIGCPPGSTSCRSQGPTPKDDTCGKELDHWMAIFTAPPKPPPKVPPKPRPEITLDTLPKECRVVLEASGPPQPPDRPSSPGAPR